MLPDDLLANIQRLPLDEKMTLLKRLMQAVNEELRQQSCGVTASPDAKRAREMLGTDGYLPPFETLHGILATDMSLPTEYDWKDDYTDYLTEKYA
jgi:hypothetical protein